MKIFLDANIFIAAAGNPDGGSGYLFRIAELESWTLITTLYALLEARHNIQKKLPKAEKQFLHLISHRCLLIAVEAPEIIHRNCKRVIVPKDVPILAAAIFSKSFFLCTLDQADFHTTAVKLFCKKFHLTIQTPWELLHRYRKQLLKQ